MTKGKALHSEMAHACQIDGINVIFDQNSPASAHTRSRSKSSCDRGCPSGSGSHRGRVSHRGRRRLSSSSSGSSSGSRSRSHPRCHRRSSRCRCDNDKKYGRGHYMAHSSSRSPSPDRYSRHGRSRVNSRSSRRRSRRAASRFTYTVSQSPSRTYKSRSRSSSSGCSISLTLNDKGELLQATKTNAMKILGVEKLELPECVTPILSEQSASKWVSAETWVTQDPEKTLSQGSDVEPDDMCHSTTSPKRKISFSINNSVVKPIVAAPACPKVTPRVDRYESRNPYGHWVPVKSGRAFNRRKPATSH